MSGPPSQQSAAGPRMHGPLHIPLLPQLDPNLEESAVAILIPMETKMEMNPNGSGFIISDGKSKVNIQMLHSRETPIPYLGDFSGMTCTKIPTSAYNSYNSNVHGITCKSSGNTMPNIPPPAPMPHRRPIPPGNAYIPNQPQIPIPPPPVVQPFNYYMCKNTGKWYPIYRNIDCPEYFRGPNKSK